MSDWKVGADCSENEKALIAAMYPEEAASGRLPCIRKKLSEAGSVGEERKKMFRDCALKYYEKENDWSCSETLIRAANEYYELKLSEDVLLAMSAFSGGMYVGGMCGAVSGSIAAIGILYSNGHAHQSEEMKALVPELISRFQERLEVSDCTTLKEKYKTPEIRCGRMIAAAADVLEEILKENPYAKR